MASRYRALLIGTSTYPADEHNLQTLKGPVKDIAALNRALADPDTGLFADVDVTLLPEPTSGRAIRALGRFFGAASRDDVLLLYFSGHGKLDQSGRLHLCMQDTESADLLATAVSSARLSEFAEASRARNVVIVLDCCHAGAFRGGDLPDAVAGPGRYVLTSCRSTQLANDATVANGTSYFTQNLVDGLLYAAADQDQDGYVTFSDLYAYVDRRLRQAGKQIPQRRVDGDGDLRLARRAVRAAAGVSDAAAAPPAPGAPPGLAPDETSSVGDPARAGDDAPSKGSAAAGSGPPGRPRRGVLLAAAGAAAVLAVGGITAGVLLSGGAGPGSGDSGVSAGRGAGSYVAAAPWRLKAEDDIEGSADKGCTITLTEAGSGNQVLRVTSLYAMSMFQIAQRGSFRWRASDPGCSVVPLAGSGHTRLPFTAAISSPGDTDAFAAPPQVAVHVKDYYGDTSCELRLYDPADGTELDFATAKPGADTVTLSTGGRARAYVGTEDCAFQVSAAR
jgi:Caspase domain